MRRILKFIAIGPTIILLMILAVFFSIECYWPFNPHIDTKFAANFDIAKFDEIKKGDSIQQVSAALGQPIWKQGCGGCWEQQSYVIDNELRVPPDRKCESLCNAEYQYWQFSDDNACTWWDFAWHYFAIDFHNGKVIDKRSNWLRD